MADHELDMGALVRGYRALVDETRGSLISPEEAEARLRLGLGSPRVIHWIDLPQTLANGVVMACGLRARESKPHDYAAPLGDPGRVNCEGCLAWMEANRS
jgi:hypothetical protein